MATEVEQGESIVTAIISIARDEDLTDEQRQQGVLGIMSDMRVLETRPGLLWFHHPQLADVLVTMAAPSGAPH